MSIRILGHACKPNDSASVQLLFAIPVLPVAGPKSRAVACGIERLHGEWLVLMCCDVMGDHYDNLCVHEYLRHADSSLVSLHVLKAASGRRPHGVSTFLMPGTNTCVTRPFYSFRYRC